MVEDLVEVTVAGIVIVAIVAAKGIDETPYEPLAGCSNKCRRLVLMELFVGGNTPDLSRGCNPVNTPATVRYSSGANVLLAVGKTYFQKADSRAAKSQRRSDVRREDRTCQWESKPWESKPAIPG